MKRMFVLAALAMAVPSMADAGPYLGVGLGGVRMESTLANLGDSGLVPGMASDVEVIGSDPDWDSTDVSMNVVAGWMFGSYIGVEVGYVDFGKGSQNFELPEVCSSFGCQSREWTAQAKVDGVQAFLVGNLPVNDTFDVYAKIGAIDWDAELDGFERNAAVVPGQPLPERNDPISTDDDGTDLAFGLGVNLKTESPFSIRADFTYYDLDITDETWVLQFIALYNF